MVCGRARTALSVYWATMIDSLFLSWTRTEGIGVWTNCIFKGITTGVLA